MNANEVRACEVMRKACVDLLRSGGSNPEKRTSRPGGPRGYPGGNPGGGYHPEPLSPAFEAEVLEALEKLGEEANQSEPRTPGEPSGPTRRASWSVCGCHGQVPPARVCENPVDPRANLLKQRACPWHPSPEVATRTGAPGMPGPPYDGAMGQGQSGHCPGCLGGGHEGHAVPATKHGSVGLDHAHPP